MLTEEVLTKNRKVILKLSEVDQFNESSHLIIFVKHSIFISMYSWLKDAINLMFQEFPYRGNSTLR